jgi:hypothetical protein
MAAGDDPGIEGLDGDGLPGVGVGRPVDLAHAAPIEEVLLWAAYYETIGDLLSWAHRLTSRPPRSRADLRFTQPRRCDEAMGNA